MPELKAAYDAALSQLTAEGSPFSISRKSLNGVEYKMYDAAPKSLLDVFEAAAAHGDREFLVYEGERFTFNDMLQEAARIGHQLVNQLGVAKGDRVAIAMRNYPEWMSAYIAITCIGAVVVPLNSWGQAKELEYAINDAAAKVVFCDHQRYAMVADWLLQQGITAVIARPEGTEPQTGSYTLLEFIAGSEGAAMPEVTLDPEDLVMILYTSGTTGVPKGVPYQR